MSKDLEKDILGVVPAKGGGSPEVAVWSDGSANVGHARLDAAGLEELRRLTVEALAHPWLAEGAQDGKMLVYEACTFGRIPEEDEVERDEMHCRHVTKAYGKIVLGRFISQARAKQVLEEAFLAEEDDRSTWVKEARVWALSRDPARKGQLYLWAMVQFGAPAMGDPDRTPYPQARETHFWVETLDVVL